MTVYGDGKQTRCFLYIDDAVRAVMALARERGAMGEIFNIGNPKSISILKLAQKIKNITESKSRIVHVPYEKAYEKGFEDMRHRKPDITKLKKLLRFSPKIGIEELLERTVRSFKK